MLLNILEFGKTIDLPAFQYTRGMKHWGITLNENGDFQEITPLTRENKKGKIELGNSDLPASPHRNRNGVDAKLLTDTAEYVLEFGDKERRKKYHQAYIDLLNKCYEQTQEPSIAAVIKFLENNPLPKLEAYLEKYPIDWEIEANHVIRFEIENQDPTELETIQQFWVQYCSNDNLPEQPCLVTGKVEPITTKFEHKLKSVPNTQGSGASFISAYCDSFHSYGRKGAEVSPIGVNTSEKIGQILSYLESQSKHRMRAGSILYLFWCREGDFDLNDFLNEPSEEDVRLLLEAINSGKKFDKSIKSTDFYVLTLSGASGRIVVRDYLQTTVEQVKDALGKWFDAQHLIDIGGKSKKPMGLYALAAQAYRDAKKELQSHTVVELSRCILQGKPLPKDLLHKVLERVRVQRKVNYRQASLIKLVLTSWGVNITVNLDERMKLLKNSQQKQAYCCGRLLATFSSIQYYALGGEVNKTIIDSGYGAAATTPNRIFGALESKVQNYLTELRKKKPGLAVLFNKQLEEIHSAMPGATFPNTLTLEEQGIFAMGYWHQKAYVSNQNTENSNQDKEIKENA